LETVVVVGLEDVPIAGVVIGDDRHGEDGCKGPKDVFFSVNGVDGRLLGFGGPSSTSSALRLARSTVSRKLMAASKFVRQYAASPSTLLAALNLWIK